MSRRQNLLASASLAAALLVSGSCGSSPAAPGPGPIVSPPVTAPNAPPTISAITTSVSRAEVDTDVTVTAAVSDAETPVSQLKFEWKADAGTITGQGATVTWRTPKDVSTPADYTIKLTVTETVASTGGAAQQNVVNATSPAIRVHDSPKELGDLSLRFLGDFANSSVSPSTCIRDFSNGCSGKNDEKADIEANREHFVILDSSLRLRNVRVASSGLSADMTVTCGFTSRIIKCDAGSVGCVVGSVGSVSGDCTLTGVYEQQRWWLCTSHFTATKAALGFRSFFSSKQDQQP